ncbi:MAG: hypothetical protein Q8L57_03600, partial [bacterium]|nr:hypothetical protein [bacterium]
TKNELPSVKDNLKSSVQELWGIFSGFDDYLKSQIIPQPQTVTPLPKPAESLPPAVKLPQ